MGLQNIGQAIVKDAAAKVTNKAGNATAKETVAKAAAFAQDALMINGKVRNDLHVVKLAQGVLEDAKKVASLPAQGADDIFFRANEETFVASGRGLLKQRKLWNVLDVDPKQVEVTLHGKPAEVIHVDNQANDVKEGVQWALQYGTVQATAMATMASLSVAPVVTHSAAATAATVGATAIGTAASIASGGAFMGPRRALDLRAVDALGEVVQKGTLKNSKMGETLAAVLKRA